MTDEPLFDDPVERGGPDRYVTDGMGCDAARTARQKAMIEDGVHPATRLPLMGPGTCGDCVHAIQKQVRTFKGWKCRLVVESRAPGDGPDLRKWWPSCAAWTHWERVTEAAS